MVHEIVKPLVYRQLEQKDSLDKLHSKQDDHRSKQEDFHHDLHMTKARLEDIDDLKKHC